MISQFILHFYYLFFLSKIWGGVLFINLHFFLWINLSNT